MKLVYSIYIYDYTRGVHTESGVPLIDVSWENSGWAWRYVCENCVHCHGSVGTPSVRIPILTVNCLFVYIYI